MYMKKAVDNYKISKSIGKQLGYPSTIVEIFSTNSIIRSVVSRISEMKPHYMEKMRLKALDLMFKKRNLSPPYL